MKRILTNAKLKNEILSVIKCYEDYELTIGIYTLEGEDNASVQDIEILINDDYDNMIAVTEQESQIEEYSINQDLRKEAEKIVKFLSDNFNVNEKITESVSY